jgi:hypothetical protein
MRTIQLEAVAFDPILHLSPVLHGQTQVRTSPDPNASDSAQTEQMRQFLTVQGQPMREWYTTSRNLARWHSLLLTTTHETSDDVFWELCMNAPFDIDQQNKDFPVSLLSSPITRRVFEFFVLTDTDTLLAHKGPVSGMSLTEAVALQNHLTRKWSFAVCERAFCITTSGFIGLVPRLLEKGDVLAHVKGRHMPVVLRAIPSAARTVEWTGACYVHRVEDVYNASN